jgi:hypothetical protein
MANGRNSVGRFAFLFINQNWLQLSSRSGA